MNNLMEIRIMKINEEPGSEFFIQWRPVQGKWLDKILLNCFVSSFYIFDNRDV
jgi:hypothetical protein